MSKIINKSEAWQGHNRGEVETFIKEQIPDSEHVVVKIRGCEWDADNNTDKSASVTGGKVIVKAFNPATTENLPVQEYAIPAPAAGEKASIVELDIQHGLHYQIHSEVDGLGASFRLVFTSSLESREVFLWNCSLGVWKASNSWLWSDSAHDGDGAYSRVTPVFGPSGTKLSDIVNWDADGDLYNDDSASTSVLVSTADASFLLTQNDKSSEVLAWSEMNYGRNVPGLEEFFETAGQDYTAAQELAKADFDGALNSDKILDALSEAPAAQFAAKSNDHNFVRELPAAGALLLIYQNKEAINTIITDIGDNNLPQIDNGCYWSSSASSRLFAWFVDMSNGGVNGDESNKQSVLALSAFHFYY